MAQKKSYPATTEEYDRLVAASAGADRTEPRAIAVQYDVAARSLVLSMRGGATLTVPIDRLRGFEAATETQLSNVQLFDEGSEIDWPDLDESIEITVLLPHVLGIMTASEVGRKGGSAKSPAKALSSARNGAKGGRPRKKIAA